MDDLALLGERKAQKNNIIIEIAEKGPQ